MAASFALGQMVWGAGTAGTFLVSLVANVGIASAFFGEHYSSWWVSDLAGSAVGIVCHYAASSVFTWRRR
jgi:putative flippase GtrA